MDTGAIFLLLAVLFIAGLLVASPFIEKRRMTVVSAEEQELSGLMAERDRLITALQELDFDHTLGKIPAEDYPDMRAELMQRAAGVLRKLDMSQSHSSASTDAESRIEAVIAARRADAAARRASTKGKKAASPGTEADDDLEALIAARKATRKEKSAGFCTRCGKPVLRSDRFCPHCGKPLT